MFRVCKHWRHNHACVFLWLAKSARVVCETKEVMACLSSTSDSQYVKTLNSVARSRYLAKLTYNKGLSTLPDPFNLKGWENNPMLWPDVTYGDIYTYLIDMPGVYTKEALKAFKSLEAYQFFVSGHVKLLWYHSVGDSMTFCFIKGKVIRSQRINDKPHDAWICLHKSEASVYCARYTCMAGLVLFPFLFYFFYAYLFL